MRNSKLLCFCLIANFSFAIPTFADVNAEYAKNDKEVIHSNESKITLDVKNATIKYVLDKIHEQTGYDFIYSSTQLKDMPLITKKVNEMPMKVFLTQLFQGTNFSFTVNGKIVTIKKGASKKVSCADFPQMYR